MIVVTESGYTLQGHFSMVCLEAPLNTQSRVVRACSTDGVCEVPLSIRTMLATYSAVLLLFSLVWKVLASYPFQGVITVMVSRCCLSWLFLAQGNCQLMAELHLRKLPLVASVCGQYSPSPPASKRTPSSTT